MASLETVFSEPRQLTLGLALFLFDGFTDRNELLGLYSAREHEVNDEALTHETAGRARVGRYTTVRIATRRFVPRRRESEATFLFFGLPAGAHTFEVRSPYYAPLDLTLTVPRPDPKWPAFPDVTLANEALPLESPLQPAAYRSQRASVTLQPSVRYPFPGGTTLVRGAVRSGGQVLEGATVRRQGSTRDAATDVNGEYVLYFNDIAGTGQNVTLEALHPLHPTVSAPVALVRGLTVVKEFALP
jgi:hypothetical protein